jgi:hypothetical protein
MNESDDKFAKEAKALFDESVDRLDAETLSALNRRRHAALEAARGARPEWVRWAPAAGVTAAVVIAVMLATPRPGGVDAVPLDDMDILLGEDSIEMLEDLEFYAWMELQDGDVG